MERIAKNRSARNLEHVKKALDLAEKLPVEKYLSDEERAQYKIYKTLASFVIKYPLVTEDDFDEIK